MSGAPVFRLQGHSSTLIEHRNNLKSGYSFRSDALTGN